MLFFNSIGIAVAITILCCNKCDSYHACCNKYYYETGYNECDNIHTNIYPDQYEKNIIKEFVRDTVYIQGTTRYIIRYIPKYIYKCDTLQKYISLKDTIYRLKHDTIINSISHLEQYPIKQKASERKNKSSKLSVYGGGGVMTHDIKSDQYTTPYYKTSYSGYVGMTYKTNNRIRYNGELNYSAPYQFLYNSQYIGVAGTLDYDLLESTNNDLTIGTGCEYDYSYNKRTFINNDNQSSIHLNTHNVYIPVKVSYEHIFNNIGIGPYVRYRQNIVGEDLSHKYMLDGGIQMRYYIK